MANLMKRLTLFVTAAALAGCATPVVMLKHDGTGQVARCGGGVAGSMAGGVIGRNIEEANDQQCVRDYEARGFRRLDASPSQPPPAAKAEPASVTTSAHAPAQVGRDAFVAERLARDARCSQSSSAALVAKGPGFESYSVQCASGDVMLVRCEMGNCRTLR